MRLSTFSGLLAATLLATSGVFAYVDEESTGSLTARDVFEDGDLLQERDFNEIDEIDARDYFEDELEARGYSDEDIVEARDFLDIIDELEARGYSAEDLLEARRFRLKGLGRTLGRIGKGALGVAGRVAASQIGLGRRDFEDDEELFARAKPLSGLAAAGRLGGGRARGGPLAGGDRIGGGGRIGGGRLGGPSTIPGRGGHGTGHRHGGRTSLSSGGLGGRLSTGKGAGFAGGLTRTHRSRKAAVEARDFFDDELEERGPGAAGAQVRRKRKNQAKRLRNKLRKQKQAAAAGGEQGGAAGAAGPGAPAAEPAAAVQARGLEVDQLD